MSHKSPRCDSCSERIRENQHGLLLSDLETGQLLGSYHARIECQERAAKYFDRPGSAFRATIMHPHRCGPDFEACDATVGEVS